MIARSIAQTSNTAYTMRPDTDSQSHVRGHEWKFRRLCAARRMRLRGLITQMKDWHPALLDGDRLFTDATGQAVCA